MLRLIEVALFLVPFALFLVWRLISVGRGPTGWMLGGALLALGVLGVGLAWFGTDRALNPAGRYVPALWQNGQIIPGHSATQ